MFTLPIVWQDLLGSIAAVLQHFRCFEASSSSPQQLFSGVLKLASLQQCITENKPMNWLRSDIYLSGFVGVREKLLENLESSLVNAAATVWNVLPVSITSKVTSNQYSGPPLSTGPPLSLQDHHCHYRTTTATTGPPLPLQDHLCGAR